jgi:hypothetical protein
VNTIVRSELRAIGVRAISCQIPEHFVRQPRLAAQNADVEDVHTSVGTYLD